MGYAGTPAVTRHLLRCRLDNNRLSNDNARAIAPSQGLREVEIGVSGVDLGDSRVVLLAET